MGKMKNLYSEGVTDLFSYGQGQRDKQERIIKLLEQHLGYGDSEWDEDVMAVIALIKGENNAD